jgi:uncharacterized alkaline shock family protein YloU
MAEKKIAEEKSTSSRVVIDTSTDKIGGTVSIDDSVVASIAGYAVRDVEGVHSLGKSRLLPFRNSASRGVDAEVGNTQAALDLDVVVEFGHDIQKVARTLRQLIAAQVEKMAGREVVEVNIHVVDVKLPDETPKKARARVQ